MWQVFNFVRNADYWLTTQWAMTHWSSAQKPPRTCSYCGSIHPEDAITFVAAGWTVEHTTKLYKRYLHPPDPYRDPLPMVKLYLQHFTLEQREQFNEVLRIQLGLPDGE